MVVDLKGHLEEFFDGLIDSTGDFIYEIVAHARSEVIENAVEDCLEQLPDPPCEAQSHQVSGDSVPHFSPGQALA